MRNRIDEFLKNVISDIKEDQETKNIRASGASANSLKPRSTEKSGEITGFRYIGAQRFGRKPGKFPKWSKEEGFKELKEWMEIKNIKPKEPDMPIDTLAFLIARKISREGTDIYTNKRPALAVSDIVEIRLDELKSNLLEDQIKEIKANVILSLKTILQ